MFFAPRVSTKMRKHHLFDDFSGLAKMQKIRCAARTTRTTRTRTTTTTTTTTTIRKKTRTRTRTRTRARADLRSSGAAKLHKIWLLVQLHIHMSFAIAETPRLPRRIFPLTAMCLLDSFSAFSACGSIHKHTCLRVMSTRMFAIFPPFSRYPLPAALCPSPGTWSHFQHISAALGPQLPYCTNPVQTCAANTNSSAWQPRMPPTRRASQVCEALQYVYKYKKCVYTYIYIYTRRPPGSPSPANALLDLALQPCQFLWVIKFCRVCLHTVPLEHACLYTGKARRTAFPPWKETSNVAFPPWKETCNVAFPPWKENSNVAFPPWEDTCNVAFPPLKETSNVACSPWKETCDVTFPP